MPAVVIHGCTCRWVKFASSGTLAAVIANNTRKRTNKPVNEATFYVSANEVARDLEEYAQQLLKEYSLKFWLFVLHKETGFTVDEVRSIVGFNPLFSDKDEIWKSPFGNAALSVLKSVPKASLQSNKAGWSRTTASMQGYCKSFVEVAFANETGSEVLYPFCLSEVETDVDTVFRKKFQLPSQSDFKDVYQSWLREAQRLKLVKDRSKASRVEHHQKSVASGQVVVCPPTANNLFLTGKFIVFCNSDLQYLDTLPFYYRWRLPQQVPVGKLGTSHIHNPKPLLEVVWLACA